MTRTEIRELALRMKSAFELCASRKMNFLNVTSALSESPDVARARTQRYGEEFKRVLEGENDFADLPSLRTDLSNLIARGCPDIDIVELMLACTRKHRLSISDSLRECGFNTHSLGKIENTCRDLSKQITALNTQVVQSPLYYAGKHPSPPGRESSELQGKLFELPLLLDHFADILHLYPPKAGPLTNAKFLNNFELLFFKILLKQFGHGNPTLSYILKAMRDVRQAVSPESPGNRRIRRARVHRSEESESAGRSNVRDPFEIEALQRRINRFSRENPKLVPGMVRVVKTYLSGNCSSGKTLLEAWPSLTSSMHRSAPSKMLPIS